MLKLKTNQFKVPVYGGFEKRKHKRIDKPVIIRFRIKPHIGQENVSSDWDMVGVNDLSAGGMFFNSSYNLEIGTILDLKIGFSTSSTPVQSTGIVTRVKKHSNTSIFGIATAFMDIDNVEEELINKFINEVSNIYLAI